MPMPASQPVVTQLTIDASGATAGEAQYEAAMVKAEAVANRLVAVNDNLEKLFDRQGETMKQVAAANDNVSRSWGGLVDGAENVGSSLEKTTENILNTINHLKLLALGIYAISPAFRSMVNAAIPTAIGFIGDAAATAAKSVLSFFGPMLSFFARITGPIAVAVIAWKSLNYVWQQGVDLLDKYRSGSSGLLGSDFESKFKQLTQFQTDTVSADQARYAGELADRLATAKTTISEFFEVQLDVTNLALKLQGLWVGVVEAIAGAVRGINAIVNAVPGWFVDFINAVATVYKIGSSVSFPGMTPPAAPKADRADYDPALAAARSTLAIGLGIRNAGKDGAPLGGTLLAKYNADVRSIYDVNFGGGNQKDKHQTNAYQRADQSVQDQIDQLRLEADGASRTSQAYEELKVKHELNVAAMKAGIEPTQAMQDQWKKYGDTIADLTLKIRAQQALQQQLFQGATMFMSPADQAAANVAHQIDPRDWQSHMHDLASPAVAFNRSLVPASAPAANDNGKDKRERECERSIPHKAA